MNVQGVEFLACLSSAQRIAAALAVIALGLAGLPEPAAAASGRISIESGGVARTALLIEHRRLKKARRPVVIVLRGGKDRAARLRRVFGFEDMARSSGPVLIYPDPIGGHWSDIAGAEASRDATFIRDLIAKLVSDGVADRHRIFIIGVSSGGPTVLRLACDDANLFTGVAAVVTGMPADLAATCKPSRPLPFLMIAGTADPVVPYKGGKSNWPEGKTDLVSVDAAMAIFVKAAGCGDGRTTTAFPDRDPHDGSRAYLDRWNGCKAPVELVRVEGGGHTIPGHVSAPSVDSARGPRNADIDSAKIIWDFFRRLGD